MYNSQINQLIISMHALVYPVGLSFPYLCPNRKAIIFHTIQYNLLPNSSVPPLHPKKKKTESLCLLKTMPFQSSSFLFMAPLLFPIFFLLISSSSAQGPPSPGYSPSSKVNTIGFEQGFRNLWGSKHQSLDQGSLTIYLDSSSG